MRSSFTEYTQSSGISNRLSRTSTTYNLTRGLRAVYCGSAFLPAFVLDECHAALDGNGFDFVRKCIEAIEEKGIREQGLYRNCGVTSKVQKLMQIGLDRRRSVHEKLSFADDEWEIKTLSSALKTFLRNLPEPLMTFDLHPHFINAAKMDSKSRVSTIHYFVYKLPEIHFEMLQIIIEHLKKVADRSNENLMTVGNLGVCFGPTLLRPKEETMAAIMDIKFCNVVVEVLIANYDLIFKKKPIEIATIPCPSKANDQEEVVVSEDCSSGEAIIASNIVFSKQQTSPVSQEEKRSQSESTLSSNKRPQTIASATICQRPPPIYDRVACSHADSSDDLSLNSTNRLVLAYGKPSTSAGASPVTPITNNSLTCSASTLTQNTGKCQVRQCSHGSPGEHSRSVVERERRTQSGKKYAESWESLNSAASGSDPSPSPNERFRQHPKIQEERRSITPRGAFFFTYNYVEWNKKISGSLLSAMLPYYTRREQEVVRINEIEIDMRFPEHTDFSFVKKKYTFIVALIFIISAKLSVSYAPAYNPFSSESSITAPNLSPTDVGNSCSGRHKISLPLPISKYQQHRCLALSRSSKSINLPGVGGSTIDNVVTGDGAISGATATGTEALLSELRVSPLFTYTHPLGTLQPSRRVKTLYACTAGHNTELSFQPGQIITNVYESKEDGWLIGTLNGKTGLIPANYVEPLP
uniref:Uncharacterized protein n=1 Tax=Setaria digitata TaxID=48799 RepID=A0A915PXJ2_9BILA